MRDLGACVVTDLDGQTYYILNINCQGEPRAEAYVVTQHGYLEVTDDDLREQLAMKALTGDCTVVPF